jgi:hypothetical protein
VPFFTPSEQVAVWHVPKGPEAAVQPDVGLHTPLTQSAPEQQFLPSAQVAPQQLGPPPQSLSVSHVSFVLFPQVFTETQIPPAQLPLTQSPPTEHFRPFAHFLAGAQLPPQSTSVSLPFSTVSLQAGALHWEVALGHQAVTLVQQTWLLQSVPAPHA